MISNLTFYPQLYLYIVYRCMKFKVSLEYVMCAGIFCSLYLYFHIHVNKSLSAGVRKFEFYTHEHLYAVHMHNK